MIWHFSEITPARFEKALQNFDDKEYSPHFSWTAESLNQEARLSQVWGAWDGGTLAGFIVYRPNAPEAEIFATYVWPSYRRHGLMTQLLKALVEHKPAISKWFLEAHPTNAAAISTYLGLGFTQVGVRPRYYSDGSDAWVYQLLPGDVK